MTESLFLKALSLGIAHSLWQGALLWLCYYAWQWLANPSAEKKYYLSAAMVMSQMVVFIATVSFHWMAMAGHVEPISLGLGINPASNWWQYVQQASAYVSMIYLVAIAFLSLRIAAGRRQLQQLMVADTHKAPLEWRLFVQQHAALLNIRRKVTIFLSPYVQSPLTAGFWKPIILMPIAAVNHLTCQQAEAILLHELVHIRRHDYLINLALQMAGVIFFFHPFIKLLLREAEQQREHSCDDWVLQFRFNALDYARALLALQQQQIMKPAIALGASSQGSFALLHRIRRMVEADAGSMRSADKRWALPLAIVMLLAAFAGKPLLHRKHTPANAINAAIEKLPLYNYQKGYAYARINKLIPLASDVLFMKPLPEDRLQQPSLSFENYAEEVNTTHGNVDEQTSNDAVAELRQAQSLAPLVLNKSQAAFEVAKGVAFDASENLQMQVKDLSDAQENQARLQAEMEAQQERMMMDKLAAMDEQYQKLGAKLEYMSQSELAAIEEKIERVDAAAQLLQQRTMERQSKVADPNHQFSYSTRNKPTVTAPITGKVAKRIDPIQSLVKGKISSIDHDVFLQEIVMAIIELTNNAELEPSLKSTLAEEIINEFGKSEYAQQLKYSHPDDYRKMMQYLRSKAPKKVVKF